MIPTSIITRDLGVLTKDTENIYESIVVISKRAVKLSADQKEELTKKLAEFASPVDNLEEIFENKEQIEISRYYERMPKRVTVATEEFIEDKLTYQAPEKENEE